MEKFLCNVKNLTVCLLLISLHTVALTPEITLQQSIEAPEFRPPQFPAYENDLIFGMYNPNADGVTEIYRSRHETDGFERIDTVPATETTYLDEDLRPNTTYYYKLRARVGETVSDFSEVLSLTSGHKLYPPQLTATPLTCSSIEVTLQDVSYNDTSYDLWRDLGPDGVFIRTITAPDSGEVFTIVDTGLVANTTYTYRVDVHARGPGNVFYPGMVTMTATTSEGTQPAVLSLTLVDPATDMDVAQMYDSIEISVDDHLNIRANTNENTESVAFFVNGQRYWGENQEPYAIFGDWLGDYHRGRFLPGEYTVTAVPYSERFHTGITGESKSIYFRVVDNNGSMETSFAAVDVYPNPVTAYATVEIAGEADAQLSMEIIDQYGKAVDTFEEAIDNFGWFTEDINLENLESGTYYLNIKTKNATHTKRILVK